MKNNLLVIILLIFSQTVNAQILQNTIWEVYNSDGTFHSYYKYKSDTLYISSDNVNYSILSTFEINGNNFTIIDFMNPPPCLTEIGSYTFELNNDTLDFTLINDDCTSRATRHTTNIWTNQIICTTTDQIEPIENKQITTYPNPVVASFFINIEGSTRESKYNIYNQRGEEVISGRLSNGENRLNLDELPSGIYFLKIMSSDLYMTKIVKK